MTSEQRVVNEKTGGAKGSKLARFDLIPPEPLIMLAEHYGRGCQKYADRNWEKGYDWGLSYAALQRHSAAFWAGETYDPEWCEHPEAQEHTAECVPHMVAVAWHAFALLEFQATHPELDDRPKRPEPNKWSPGRWSEDMTNEPWPPVTRATGNMKMPLVVGARVRVNENFPHPDSPLGKGAEGRVVEIDPELVMETDPELAYPCLVHMEHGVKAWFKFEELDVIG